MVFEHVSFTIEYGIRIVSEANVHGRRADAWRRTKEQRMCAKMQLNPWVRWLRVPATVRLVRVGPKTLDDDNLQRALKATRDGVADAFGRDDGKGSGITWAYGQEKGTNRTDYRVRIQIEC